MGWARRGAGRRPSRAPLWTQVRPVAALDQGEREVDARRCRRCEHRAVLDEQAAASTGRRGSGAPGLVRGPVSVHWRPSSSPARPSTKAPVQDRGEGRPRRGFGNQASTPARPGWRARRPGLRCTRPLPCLRPSRSSRSLRLLRPWRPLPPLSGWRSPGLGTRFRARRAGSPAQGPGPPPPLEGGGRGRRARGPGRCGPAARSSRPGCGSRRPAGWPRGRPERTGKVQDLHLRQDEDDQALHRRGGLRGLWNWRENGELGDEAVDGGEAGEAAAQHGFGAPHDVGGGEAVAGTRRGLRMSKVASASVTKSTS